jgi:hypothetical protein
MICKNEHLNFSLHWTRTLIVTIKRFTGKWESENTVDYSTNSISMLNLSNCFCKSKAHIVLSTLIYVDKISVCWYDICMLIWYVDMIYLCWYIYMLIWYLYVDMISVCWYDICMLIWYLYVDICMLIWNVDMISICWYIYMLIWYPYVDMISIC